jgi:hypothetical protein
MNSMFERILAVLDVVLLLWIVVQGEAIRFYERELFHMNKERFDERKKWREQKRLQLSKKETAQKTNESSPSSESPSPTETVEPKSKTISAKSVEDYSKDTDPRT